MYAMQWSIRPSPERTTTSTSIFRPPAATPGRTGGSGKCRGPAPSNRLLLVEKDASIQAALTTFLAEQGFHVSAAASTDEALRCLTQAPLPRLILLDLDTAVPESLEVCRQRLQASGLRGIPLVALSAGPCLPAPLALALGIVAQLDKPLYRDTLLETVQRLCA